MHRRRIALEKRARRVVVEDTLQMAGTHDVELFFHCSECCRVSAIPGGYALVQGGRTLRITLPRAEGASSHVRQGGVDPICGWVSRRFDAKEPAPTIVWQARVGQETVLRSEIIC